MFLIQGRKIPPIWSLQGEVDIENAIKRFRTSKVRDSDLTFLEQADNYIIVKPGHDYLGFLSEFGLHLDVWLTVAGVSGDTIKQRHTALIARQPNSRRSA